MSTEPILQVRELRKHFPVTQGIIRQAVVGAVKAVDGVSFEVAPGETFGLVGESGCGKTTTGRCILQLERPTAGEVIFEGQNLADATAKDLRRIRRRLQVIFQDPFSSLNPRMTVGQIIAEPMRVHGVVASKAEAQRRVGELLAEVGLPAAMARRYPHEMSGGQRQRVGIARALGLRPAFIVCDEPVSALDVSIQAQIVNLLEDLQQKYGLAYLFIAHDLAVVRHLSHRLAVMYLGKMVETAPSDSLYDRPLHPYTQALLAAAPVPDPRVEAARPHTVLAGEVPSPLNPPSGCAFHPRCPIAVEECRRVVPELREVRPGHRVACIRV